MYGVRKSSTDPKKLETTNNGEGLYYNKITNPVIQIDYRGAPLEIPVDIWSKVDSIVVEYNKDATVLEDGSIKVNAKLLNNDLSGKDATWYATQVSVHALMSSVRNNTGSKENNGYPELSWGGTNIQETEIGGYPKETDAKLISQTSTADADVQARAALLQYGMDFGLHARWDRDTDPTNPGWSVNGYILDSKGNPQESPAWGKTDNAKLNDTVTPVIFYYSTPWSSDNGTATSGKNLKTNIQVTWEGIRKR